MHEIARGQAGLTGGALMRQAVGIDLGGSHVSAAVVDEQGKIGAKHARDLVDLSPDAVVTATADVARAALHDAPAAKAAGVGIGAPGNIDYATGAIRYSPNFHWTDVALGSRLQSALGCPVYVANDAKCATLAEYAFGAGRGTNDFVLLTLGTGIGGGIIADGELVLGHTAGVGEVGHHQIRPHDGFVCGCGKVGCFEAQASATGLIRHALALVPSFPRSALVDGPREHLNARDIIADAQAAVGHGRAAWRNYVDDLAYGLANVVAFVNPEIIALGGGVSGAGAYLTDAVAPLVEARSTMVPPGSTRIVAATMGNDAGAIGAAAIALRGGLRRAGAKAAP
jgi:glucokinase